MHDLEILKSGGYKGAGLTQFQLTCPLAAFPEEILELGGTLEELDLSGTGLSSLPANFGHALPNLKTAFFSNCKFRVFPRELATCPKLEAVAFHSNGMEEIPEDAFPLRLRWLILTDNRLTSLPSSIGRCDRLQKCMLAGNRLRDLPAEMAQCTKLGLLRLSSNRFDTLPSWLFTLPELAFLSFAGNPCAAAAANGVRTVPGLASIDWADLEVQQTLGQSESGITYRGLWKQSADYSEEVAIKLFRGVLTGDGLPADEMAACLAAGAHESLITVLGRIHGHPDEETIGPEASKFHGGIVMQLIPPHYTVLGQPPSLDTCTRDRFREDASLDMSCVLSMLTGIAGAAAHLHARGIAHGDLYAHNMLASSEDAHALLGDFGAATIYDQGSARDCEIEKLEVLAFAHLLEDMLGLVKEDQAQSAELQRRLWDLHARCAVANVGMRPSFEEVVEELEDMMGWRGMMRIPT
ncbi:hypothetical protein VTK56DRAFT_1532 [Thermocarpiscus australiensis]